jgi:hypothetical protein
LKQINKYDLQEKTSKLISKTITNQYWDRTSPLFSPPKTFFNNNKILFISYDSSFEIFLKRDLFHILKENLLFWSKELSLGV